MFLTARIRSNKGTTKVPTQHKRHKLFCLNLIFINMSEKIAFDLVQVQLKLVSPRSFEGNED